MLIRSATIKVHNILDEKRHRKRKRKRDSKLREKEVNIFTLYYLTSYLFQQNKHSINLLLPLKLELLLEARDFRLERHQAAESKIKIYFL